MKYILDKFNNKEDIRKFIKFTIVGFSNTFVTFIFFSITFKILNLHYLMASSLGYLAGFINSYYWNLRWTFKSNHSNMILLKFVIVNVVALSVNLLIMRLLVEKMAIDEFISQFVAIGIALIVNFGGNNFWTFRNNNE